MVPDWHFETGAGFVGAILHPNLCDREDLSSSSFTLLKGQELRANRINKKQNKTNQLLTSASLFLRYISSWNASVFIRHFSSFFHPFFSCCCKEDPPWAGHNSVCEHTGTPPAVLTSGNLTSTRSKHLAAPFFWLQGAKDLLPFNRKN